MSEKKYLGKHRNARLILIILHSTSKQITLTAHINSWKKHEVNVQTVEFIYNIWRRQDGAVVCGTPSAALFVIHCFMCVFFNDDEVLVYDRQTLMDIRVAVETARCDICMPRTSSLPTLSYLPLHHCWRRADLPWKRKRRRKRGKQGGVAVRLRSFAWMLSPLSDGPGLACERGACWSRLDALY